MANDSERKPWDQQEGEPDAAYARFLVYLNLGPSRSLDRAYAVYNGNVTKRGKKLQAPGNWAVESSQYSWVSRSTAWDIEMMSTIGLQVILKFYSSLGIIVDKALTKLIEEKVKPKDWRQAVDAINRLGMLVPAETVQQIQDAAKSGSLTLGSNERKHSGDSV